MATQDFGLSYTVSAPALWNDTEQGSHGAASTVFATLSAFSKQGAASTLFSDLILLDKHGAASTINAINLCFQRSVLNTPLFSILNAPGTSTLSCDL